ncbi:hypothetical protein B0A50_05113 [Salinomyces thailandicus]|uniref:Telomerase reverse transcriptase n=1 Tax=Salinomyces thailandicus TaxID=706561 RepID=A0A4U0TVN3_9PEZI|nr:hypothetical protein B0A50_05113 [Salinomyces thailandica]
MKRKRKHGAEQPSKRPKRDLDMGAMAATLPLLRQYYPQVLTLRQHLASEGSKTSRKRRRKILQHGLSIGKEASQRHVDEGLRRLLDTTLVGAFDRVNAVSLESIDKDISVFTQQVNDSTTTISPTQGALRQTEIVDFVVWQLFRRDPSSWRPAHMLCHGYQRTANHGAELAMVSGIPGIFTNCQNPHVEALRKAPWTQLPSLLGPGAERILSELLLDCGIFLPVPDSNNLSQLSGTPMCELKPVSHLSTKRNSRPEGEAKAVKLGTSMCRGLSDIRFVRHRMFPPDSGYSEEGSTRYASSAAEVSAFCRAVIARVFPKEIWGSGEGQAANHRTTFQHVDRFVRLRRYESMTMHEVLQPMRIRDVSWLAPPSIQPDLKLSQTDFAKRTELLAEVLYYLFDSFLIPLIRATFHVTESNVHRNQLFYFRHDVWKAMSEPALVHLKDNMFEEWSAKSVRKNMAKRVLGVSQVRLLPKEQGMRPIINLRRRAQKLQYGQIVLARSINSILTPAFSVLNYEKDANPQRIGSALFSVADMFPRLQMFRDSLCQQGLGSVPLYFAKVDVQACFDTIPQKRLMALAERIIRADKYHVSRFARAKLVGGHNEDTPGFGARPSWKFSTKATTQRRPKQPTEAALEALDGRTRSIYVDGIVQRPESREVVLGLLKEHVEMNVIKMGNRFYRQKQGIPQGSIVSSLLCSYIYAELEQEVLGFLSGGHSLLLRLIDDFLVISTRKDIAERFMHIMHHGIPSFGVTVKAQKSLANFDVQINDEPISRSSASTAFPYCGNAIDTVTLNISKDLQRRRKSTIADSVTVEYSKLPGQTFYRKTLNGLKLQMHAMLLSTAYNHLHTVLGNLYHGFVEVAQKAYHYSRSLPADKQPGDQLVIRTIDDLIKLACVLMKRRKRTSKDLLPYDCAITNAQARWLACVAFRAVFSRRQTKHTAMLGWVSEQLRLPALRAQRKLLEPISSAYQMV